MKNYFTTPFKTQPFCHFRMEELFLKIALCDTDDKFEKIVNRHLIKIIESHDIDQEKTLEVITHIKKRINSLQNVQLPVSELFTLLLDDKSPPINMFATVFLKIGIARVKEDQLLDEGVRCFYAVCYKIR